MDDGDFAGVVKMRMGVGCVRLAVSCPAGMADTEGFIFLGVIQDVFEGGDSAGDKDALGRNTDESIVKGD